MPFVAGSNPLRSHDSGAVPLRSGHVLVIRSYASQRPSRGNQRTFAENVLLIPVSAAFTVAAEEELYT